MRLALVDLLFSWPPHGGADVDLYHVAAALQSMGHEVRLFGVRSDTSWERGVFEPEFLPFPASRLDFTGKTFTERRLCLRLREEVDAWAPDAVMVCDGFFLKPRVILALAHYPIGARFYAHELVCHRDILKFKDGAPCPKHYLYTPDFCRKCAFEKLAPDIKRGYHLAWLDEYLLAGAYKPSFFGALELALRNLSVAVVYNDIMKRYLDDFCQQVLVVPGGVDARAFANAPPPTRTPEAPKVILMTGRAEDPAKGLHVLRAAGESLRERRGDFEVHVTMPLDTPCPDWLRPLGWRDHRATKALYHAADICVVPSVWDEPFGLVALEAMASGRPVCASRVGGLQHIVAHTETGFLFEREDSAELARQLELLLDNAALRQRMGAAGRARVEERYTWRRVAERHYPEVIDALAGPRPATPTGGGRA